MYRSTSIGDIMQKDTLKIQITRDHRGYTLMYRNYRAFTPGKESVLTMPIRIQCHLQWVACFSVFDGHDPEDHFSGKVPRFIKDH